MRVEQIRRLDVGSAPAECFHPSSGLCRQYESAEAQSCLFGTSLDSGCFCQTHLSMGQDGECP